MRRVFAVEGNGILTLHKTTMLFSTPSSYTCLQQSLFLTPKKTPARARLKCVAQMGVWEGCRRGLGDPPSGTEPPMKTSCTAVPWSRFGGEVPQSPRSLFFHFEVRSRRATQGVCIIGNWGIRRYRSRPPSQSRGDRLHIWNGQS